MRPIDPRTATALVWALAAPALLALACGEEAPPPPPPPVVPVVEVIQRDQPIHLEMVGETKGSSDIPIRARVEGVLLGMHFTEGRSVQEGDLLYTIDASPFESKVVEAEGYVAESRTMVAKTKADLDRIRPLAEMKAMSQADLDGAVAQYEAAIGGLQASKARLEQAHIELSYTKLQAPIAGRIGISEAQVGEFVGKSPNPVVLNFVSMTDPIRVRFSIDERRYLQFARRIQEYEKRGVSDDQSLEARGPELELILADGSVHAHKGETNATDAAVDPQTGTFTLEADFPNPERLVLAGQFARVRAAVETRKGALLVPQRSISELQGLFHVFVVGEDGTVEQRPVEPGPKIDRLQIIESGLKPGEQVALEIMRVRAGAKIEPREVALDEKGAPIESEEAAAPGATGAASNDATES